MFSVSNIAEEPYLMLGSRTLLHWTRSFPQPVPLSSVSVLPLNLYINSKWPCPNYLSQSSIHTHSLSHVSIYKYVLLLLLLFRARLLTLRF